MSQEDRGRLNLSDSLVKKYWEKKNATFAEIFEQIKDSEYWTVDGGDASAALNHLAEVLCEPVVTENRILECEDELFTVMAYTILPKSLRILEYFDVKFPTKSGNSNALIKKLIQIAMEKRQDERYNLLLERLLLVRNFGEVASVYDPKLMKEVEQIIKEGGSPL